MDALSALSLAATVTQFVSFASKLVSKASEIHDSISGFPKDELNVETVYSELELLSHELDAKYAATSAVTVDRIFAPHVQAVRTLSRSCQADSNELLALLQKLKVEGNTTRWKSFRKALQVAWKHSEIKGFDERLRRTQVTLALQFSAFTSILLPKFMSTCNDWRLEQKTQLDEIQGLVKSIQMHLPQGSQHAEVRLPDDFKFNEVQVVQQQLSRLSLTTFNVAKQQRTLKSLRYEAFNRRRESIPDAHERTFRWAFEYGRIGMIKTRLHNWLLSSDGVFWVSGKPGSGKSTFMKFLADNHQVQKALESWAGPDKLVIGSHYFWIHGTSMQKTQEGLLRGLLFDVFRHCPQLLDLVCVGDGAFDEASSSDRTEPWTWTLKKLRATLANIGRQKSLPVRICFFIDGLDEYDGDHLAICEDFLQLASSRQVKICLSSRAWPVFEDAFGEELDKKLYIHELTHDDICIYTEDRLRSHPRWRYLTEQVGSETSAQLIEEVAGKASGVFLWVFLVTKLLRDGLTNDDTLAELQARLDGFPPDLYDFFRHMLDTVEPFYQAKLAGFLQFCLVAGGPRPVILYAFHEQEYENQNYATDMPCGKLPPEKVTQMERRTRRRINALSKGLLETTNDSCVDFLHRTVADFLKTHEISKLLSQKSTSWFHPRISFMKTSLAIVKTQQCEKVGYRLIDIYSHFTHELCRRACKTDSTTTSLFMPYLVDVFQQACELDDNIDMSDMMDEVLDSVERTLETTPFFTRDPLENGDTSQAKVLFRAVALVSDVPRYLSRRLSLNSAYFRHFAVPPLSLIAMPEHCYTLGKETTRLLLDCGHSPNEVYQDWDSHNFSSPWQMLLEGCSVNPGIFARSLQRHILLLLTYGADVNVLLGPRANSTFMPRTAWTVFFESSFRLPYAYLQSTCLTVLDAFLERGASFREPESVMGEGSTYALDSILQVFGGCVDCGIKHTARFVGEYLSRLMCKGRDAEWFRTTVWPAIRSGLGKEIQDLVEFQPPGSDPITTQSQRKRPYDVAGLGTETTSRKSRSIAEF
ncbi:hypothetical protein F4780DRAFT_372179 [Xylariomycetidae sp. FL0641]|nr:hypothetical protein F4780DRAFT_372179 [Xylariomycetidae sp. FL0641]